MEEKLAAGKKDLFFHLHSKKGDCFYAISDLDAPEEWRFLYDIRRMISDEPAFAAIESGSCVRVLLERFPVSNRDEVKDFVNTSFTYIRQNAERREQKEADEKLAAKLEELRKNPEYLEKIKEAETEFPGNLDALMSVFKKYSGIDMGWRDLVAFGLRYLELL